MSRCGPISCGKSGYSKMKLIFGSRIHDVPQAKVVCQICNAIADQGIDDQHPRWERTFLYRCTRGNAKGQYFLAGEGNSQSRWAGDGGISFIPQSRAEKYLRLAVLNPDAMTRTA